jgi:hypothetical protein
MYNESMASSKDLDRIDIAHTSGDVPIDTLQTLPASESKPVDVGNSGTSQYEAEDW